MAKKNMKMEKSWNKRKKKKREKTDK